MGIVALRGGDGAAFGGRHPYKVSHHTHSRTQLHVRKGGGGGSDKLSTLSGKEGTDAKPGRGLELEEWNLFLALVVAMTGTIALMLNGMERFYEEKVARIMGESQTARLHYEEKVARIMGESQTARHQGGAKLEATRRQDMAESQTARLQGEAKLEATRRQDMAESQTARLQGEAKLEAARLQDKVEFYEFYAKALGTRDFEPLKEALF